MKKLIRKSVFETNSSSCHSISLASFDKEFVIDTIYPDQFGKIYVEGGEFGWHWERYNDAKTKLSYAFQDGVDIGLLSKVVMDQTGATEVVFDAKSKQEGYIDHESVGNARSICVDETSTRNFIFNKNSWLFTGNDNDTPDPTFYQIPVYEGNKIITPIYAYELKIDGLKKTTKFIDYPTDEELENGINSLLEGALMTSEGLLIVEHNVYFQITRNRDFFEKSYHTKQNYSRGYIIMTKEGGEIYNLEKQLEEDGVLNDNLGYYEKSEILEKEILKRDDLHKKLNFTLNKI